MDDLKSTWIFSISLKSSSLLLAVKENKGREKCIITDVSDIMAEML